MLRTAKKVGNYIIFLDQTLEVDTFFKVFKGIQLNSSSNRLTPFKRDVAVKVVNKAEMSENMYAEASFLEEARMLKKIKSSNVVSCYDVLQTENNFYFIFELVQGGTLRTSLRVNGRMSEREVLRNLVQILNGCGELVKQKVAHIDLRPQNILIKDGKLKITGFHFAKRLCLDNSCTSTVTSSASKIPQNMPWYENTNKCDIWSLGVIVYEMMVGTTPWSFSQNSLERPRKQIASQEIEFPPQVEMSCKMQSFILGCLCKYQDNRYTWEQVFCHPLFKNIFRANFPGNGRSD